MHPQQQQGMGPCKTGIMLGGMMGAGIGGSAGIILGGAGGFFSGYRGFALLKQSAKSARNFAGSFGMMMAVAQGLRACLDND